MELAQDLLICTAAGFAMRGLGALLQNHNAETDRFLERVETLEAHIGVLMARPQGLITEGHLGEAEPLIAEPELLDEAPGGEEAEDAAACGAAALAILPLAEPASPIAETELGQDNQDGLSNMDNLMAECSIWDNETAAQEAAQPGPASPSRKRHATHFTTIPSQHQAAPQQRLPDIQPAAKRQRTSGLSTFVSRMVSACSGALHNVLQGAASAPAAEEASSSPAGSALGQHSAGQHDAGLSEDIQEAVGGQPEMDVRQVEDDVAKDVYSMANVAGDTALLANWAPMAEQQANDVEMREVSQASAVAAAAIRAHADANTMRFVHQAQQAHPSHAEAAAAARAAFGGRVASPAELADLANAMADFERLVEPERDVRHPSSAHAIRPLAATVPQLDTTQAEQVPQAASSASLWLPTEPVPLFEPSDPIAAQLQDFGEADAGQVPSAEADSVPDDSAVSDHHSAGVQHQPISSTSPPDTPQLSTPAAEQLVYDRLQELGNSQGTEVGMDELFVRTATKPALYWAPCSEGNRAAGSADPDLLAPCQRQGRICSTEPAAPMDQSYHEDAVPSDGSDRDAGEATATAAVRSSTRLQSTPWEPCSVSPCQDVLGVYLRSLADMKLPVARRRPGGQQQEEDEVNLKTAFSPVPTAFNCQSLWHVPPSYTPGRDSSMPYSRPPTPPPWLRSAGPLGIRPLAIPSNCYMLNCPQAPNSPLATPGHPPVRCLSPIIAAQSPFDGTSAEDGLPAASPMRRQYSSARSLSPAESPPYTPARSPSAVTPPGLLSSDTSGSSVPSLYRSASSDPQMHSCTSLRADSWPQLNTPLGARWGCLPGQDLSSLCQAYTEDFSSSGHATQAAVCPALSAQQHHPPAGGRHMPVEMLRPLPGMHDQMHGHGPSLQPVAAPTEPVPLVLLGRSTDEQPLDALSRMHRRAMARHCAAPPASLPAWQQPLPISIDDTEAKDELRRPVNEGGASEQNSRRTVWKQALRGNTSMTSRLAAASAADVGATGPVQAAANQRDPGSVTAGQPAEAAQQQEARAAAEGTAGLGDSEGEAPPSAEISAKAQAQQAGVSTDVDDIPELASPRFADDLRSSMAAALESSRLALYPGAVAAQMGGSAGVCNSAGAQHAMTNAQPSSSQVPSPLAGRGKAALAECTVSDVQQSRLQRWQTEIEAAREADAACMDDGWGELDAQVEERAQQAAAARAAAEQADVVQHQQDREAAAEEAVHADEQPTAPHTAMPTLPAASRARIWASAHASGSRHLKKASTWVLLKRRSTGGRQLAGRLLPAGGCGTAQPRRLARNPFAAAAVIAQPVPDQQTPPTPVALEPLHPAHPSAMSPQIASSACAASDKSTLPSISAEELQILEQAMHESAAASQAGDKAESAAAAEQQRIANMLPVPRPMQTDVQAAAEQGADPAARQSLQPDYLVELLGLLSGQDAHANGASERRMPTAETQHGTAITRAQQAVLRQPASADRDDGDISESCPAEVPSPAICQPSTDSRQLAAHLAQSAIQAGGTAANPVAEPSGLLQRVSSALNWHRQSLVHSLRSGPAPDGEATAAETSAAAAAARYASAADGQGLAPADAAPAAGGCMHRRAAFRPYRGGRHHGRQHGCRLRRPWRHHAGAIRALQVATGLGGALRGAVGELLGDRSHAGIAAAADSAGSLANPIDLTD